MKQHLKTQTLKEVFLTVIISNFAPIDKKVGFQIHVSFIYFLTHKNWKLKTKHIFNVNVAVLSVVVYKYYLNKNVEKTKDQLVSMQDVSIITSFL